MAGKISAFVPFDLDGRRPRALFMIQLSAGAPTHISVLKRWRLVHRGVFLIGVFIVLFVQHNDPITSLDKVLRVHFPMLFRRPFHPASPPFQYPPPTPSPNSHQ